MRAPLTVALLLAASGVALVPTTPPWRSTARARRVRLMIQATDPAGGAGGPADPVGSTSSGNPARRNASGSAGADPARSGFPSRTRYDRRRALAGLTGLAVILVIGGWTGLICGAVATVVADRLLRRIEPAHVRAERVTCAAGLPLAADLLAAALRSGAPVPDAAGAVAEALGGPLGERLARVARSLRLGAEPPEAWEHLAGVPGAGRLTTAAIRSSASGGALAGALHRLAGDLRADRAASAEAAARRAGVLLVLPLGLCFLPAFILAGLIPVIVAVLGDVLK